MRRDHGNAGFNDFEPPSMDHTPFNQGKWNEIMTKPFTASPCLRVSASSSDFPRLIEVAFPLKQASLASVHEKNVRHGHISTLHIWPARRPLAACRAALIATLLPDPGNEEERRKLVERIGGRGVTKPGKTTQE